jgi:hypothetical protein
MARLIPPRATAWLTIAMLCMSLCLQPYHAARAQGVVLAPAPAAQPMWVNQPPTLQVGPNGAVNLDGAMPYTAAQFQAPTYAPQPVVAAPAGTAAFVGQPWGAQAVTPQPTWGAPVAPTTAVTPPVPYFFVHRTSVFGEALYLRPRNAEVAYAIPIAGPVAPALGNEVPVGPVALVDPDYDWAFRVGGNWALDQGSSITAAYTRLRSETMGAASIAAPDVLRALVTHALGIGLATDALGAEAVLDIDLDTADIDFRSLCAGCECGDYAYAVNYIIGARYAELEQRFAASFVNVSTTTVESNIRFEGAGMRFGLQGERFFPSSGLFVYGTGITNILFGEVDATYMQTNTIGGLEAATAWSAGRVVPVLELELGVGWLGMNRHLKLSAGYRVSSWFNVPTTDDWIWAVQNSDFRDLDGTLTFDGVVGRAEWLF